MRREIHTCTYLLGRMRHRHYVRCVIGLGSSWLARARGKYMYLTSGKLLTKSDTRGELNVHCFKTKKILSYLLLAHCI